MFEDKVLKFNRAEGFYKRDAQLGNVDGAYKNFVARAKVQRSEMDNFNTPDLDQGADSILRPGETLDDFDVTFRKANAEGGRQGFDDGLSAKQKKALTITYPKFNNDLEIKKTSPLDGYDRATRKIDQGVTKINGPGERVSSKIMKHIYLDKATGKEIEVFKVKITDQPSNKGGTMKSGTGGDYKTLLSEEFSTLEEAVQSRDNYYEENPGKRIKDPNKDKISKDDRRFNIKKNQGVENYKTATKGSDVVKGHSGNIFGGNEIRPDEIIYTNEDINSKMSNKSGVVDKDKPTKFDALDFEQRATENKIEEIKKSNMSEAKKKIELRKLDNKLIEITLQSDGYKTATLSDGSKFGTSFQSTKSMDMFSEFPGMNEKQVKEFVGEYFTQDGKLKPKYANAKDLPQPVQDNIKKAYTFNENVKLAQQNAKNDIINLVKKNDPTLAKKVSITLNSGIPIDQMLAEIKKIPGADKLAKGFMKVGGPLEIAFFGLDTFNELSKGKTGKQSAKTALSNLTFGAYEGNKIEDMNVLIDTAKDLNIDSTGFNELRELQVLQNEINEDKKLLYEMAYFNKDQGGKSLTGSFDLKTRANDLTKLENEFASRSDALAENVDINSLVDNYTQTTKSLAQQQFDKSKESRSKRVYPEMGNLGSDISTTLANTYKSFLPQNLAETGLGVISNVTRPYVRAAQKIPFIGDYFKPTSDAAKLSAMNQEDRNKLLDEKTPSILENLQAPYFPKARGGIMSLTNKK